MNSITSENPGRYIINPLLLVIYSKHKLVHQFRTRSASRNPETQLCERCRCPCRPLTSQVFGSPPGGKLSGAVDPRHVTAEIFDRDFCLPRRGLFPVLQLRRLPNPPPKPSMAQEEAPPRAGELAGENAPGCPPPPRR